VPAEGTSQEKDREPREDERVYAKNSHETAGEEDRGPVRFPQIICFKCGVAGHYSSACNKPKVCFICYSKDNVVDGCPEWTKPQQAAQYLGSANKGLGFYHIDVVPREGRFRHWT
jgi:hypothetical protein